jgi:hypothetical protein
MVARAGGAAKFTFLVHSHTLRHACGFKLANDGHDTRAIQAYLGPPIDHVHGALHGLDAEPVQKILEGLTFQGVSYQTTTETFSTVATSVSCQKQTRLLLFDHFLGAPLCGERQPGPSAR